VARASLALLSGFEARLDSGASLALPTHKYKALLAFLAVPAGQLHPREKLVALLWADRSHEQGRAALRQAVWSLRRALDSTPPAALVLEGDTIGLNAEAVSVDVTDFERAATAHDPQELARAAALYRGEFLAGVAAREPPFEEWLVMQRERLAELAMEALARLLRLERKAGNTEAAVQAALRLLALEPLEESVHRTLMELYVQLGRRGAALRQYQSCVSVLERELGVEPEPDTRALYQAIVARRVAAATPHRSGPLAPAELAAASRVPGATGDRVAGVGDELPLIGRTPETGLLRQALDQAIAGRGQVVVIRGEAGIGKSRLIGALGADATAAGARLILGRSYESEQVLPFGPWVDALRQGQLALERDVVSGLRPAWRAELGRLLPELGIPGADASVLDTGHLQLFESMARLVTALAASQPLVVILEDVHWADEMSLRLFAFIARRIHGSAAVLMVFTVREEEMSEMPLLRHILEDLDRTLRLRQILVGPLDRDDTTRLVSALAGRGRDRTALTALAENVWTASEGYPFMVVETLQALREGAEPERPANLPLPERVQALVRRRLERLGVSARQLVATAAVIGRDFSFTFLQRASGLADHEAVGGIEELVRRRVFRGTGERFDFSHDRLREVARSELLPPRRRLLHGRVAEAIEALPLDELGPHATALGQHYAEAEVWDRAAVHLSRAGFEARARGAYREAAVMLQRALDALAHLPGRAVTEEALEMRLELVRSLFPMAHLEGVAEQLRQAESLAEALGNPRQLAIARIYTCEYQRTLRDYDGALEAGQAGLRIAQELGEPGLQTAALCRIGGVHLFRGDYASAIADLEAATAAGPGEMRFGEAMYTYLLAVIRLVRCLAEVGRFTDARPLAEHGVRVADAVAPHIVGAPFVLGVLCLQQGEIEECVPFLQRSLELSREQHFESLLPLNTAALAHAYALLGRKPDATALLDEFTERQRSVERPVQHGRGLIDFGRAALLIGRLEDAHRLGERALSQATTFGERGIEAEAHALVGELAVHGPRAGEARPAERHLRRALAIAGEIGMRPLAAHCHRLLGSVYRRFGPADQARAELGHAVELYRAMHMRFWLPHAEAELAEVH